MPFAKYLTHIFEHSDLEFDVAHGPFLQCNDQAPPQKARAIFLEDQQGMVIAVIPDTFRFQLSRLRSLLQRPGLRFPVICPDTTFQNTKITDRTDPGFQLIIDESINHQQQLAIYLSGGTDCMLVNVWDLIMQIEGAILGGMFSISSHRHIPLAADFLS